MKTRVTVQRSFSAPAEKVFDAWLIPTLLGNWMFGPKVRNEEIVNLENAARIGGKFSYAVTRQGQLITHIGHYMEIRRPERLVFTWGIDDQPEDLLLQSVVRIDFQQEMHKTRLKLTQELPDQHADHAERVKAGWTTMCNALAALVEKPVTQRKLL